MTVVSSHDARRLFERLVYPKRRLTRADLIRAISRDERAAREKYIMRHQCTASPEQRRAEGREKPTPGERDRDRLEDRLHGLNDLLSRLVLCEEIGVIEAVTERRRRVPSKRPVEFVPDRPHVFEHGGEIETVWIPVPKEVRRG